MAKFRKKPVVIEAVAAAADFEVETLEGIMQVYRGDIVITGVAGETYPCRLDIFLQSYEALDAEGQQVIDYAMNMAHPTVADAAKDGRVMDGVFIRIPPPKK
jgi:hypothetical protein